MAILCIPKYNIDKFRAALKSKELNIPELMKMSTEDRTAVFANFVGSAARDINLLFEQKLILKNRIQGIKNWASRVGEIGRYDPAKKANMEKAIADFEAKQKERLFNPKETESFLADLVEQKLGARISREEASTIFDLQTKADALRNTFDDTIPPKKRTPEQQKAATTYGASRVVLNKYIESLKSTDLGVREAARKAVYEFKQEWEQGKYRAVGKSAVGILSKISDSAISLLASFDNSFLGRQGLNTLQTHPTIWWKMAKESFVDFYKAVINVDPRDALYADVYSRPNYLNGRYDAAKLIPKTEEQFPVSWPGKVPVVGRIYKGSEYAFNDSAVRARIDLFDLLTEKAEKNGVDMNDVQIKDTGELVSSLTARANIPHSISGATRLVFWAPKMLKANWDVLTMHTFGFGLKTGFARKEAAINLAKIITETGLIMAIANGLRPGSAETNPTSSNFGKIKVGNRTWDYSGGKAAILTLAARGITQKTKSATTGVVSSYSPGFGSNTFKDAIENFIEGKTTPAISAFIKWAGQSDYQNKKPTPGSLLLGAFTPILVQNILQSKDESALSATLGIVLDGLGLNSNLMTTGEDWNQSTAKEMLQFKATAGGNVFNEANSKYNQQVSDWLDSVKKDPQFSILAEEDKQKVITKKKGEIKQGIFSQYGFKYKAVPTPKLPKF